MLIASNLSLCALILWFFHFIFFVYFIQFSFQFLLILQQLSCSLSPFVRFITVFNLFLFSFLEKIFVATSLNIQRNIRQRNCLTGGFVGCVGGMRLLQPGFYSCSVKLLDYNFEIITSHQKFSLGTPVSSCNFLRRVRICDGRRTKVRKKVVEAKAKLQCLARG